MPNLKTYSISTTFVNGYDSVKLHAEILASRHISNFVCLNTEGTDSLIVVGDFIVNEVALDLLMSAHIVKTFVQKKIEKATMLFYAYLGDIYRSVNYTTIGGVHGIFQANSQSQFNLLAVTTGFPVTTPSDFYWVAEDDTKVPFTAADVQNLATVIATQGWVAFKNLQVKKTAVFMAQNETELNAITW